MKSGSSGPNSLFGECVSSKTPSPCLQVHFPALMSRRTAKQTPTTMETPEETRQLTNQMVTKAIADVFHATSVLVRFKPANEPYYSEWLIVPEVGIIIEILAAVTKDELSVSVYKTDRKAKALHYHAIYEGKKNPQGLDYILRHYKSFAVFTD